MYMLCEQFYAIFYHKRACVCMWVLDRDEAHHGSNAHTLRPQLCVCGCLCVYMCVYVSEREFVSVRVCLRVGSVVS